ncbi:GvpL/GvpF family gas vesicle protein [Desulfomonile tiedjei]|uniref:Gas vesicle synthesis protein GvpL/GvpF n=1 Tax=Desulfomonile tiedjei (strain ATCC 49306 / DSM 6799 / DCB-1) TaxID=706587 RepID=I4CDB1_DESTA|nr:GvpL/GvpF family gas vesicle protein [Desulfomonile tiedjei]AFM27552.1 Gas vesicle synthesis protein GvpL/GvpF [Desulfomonile tiedjei DSM 6799]
MSNVLYLFCLARTGLVDHIEGTGITGTEDLILKNFSGVTAVTCEVPEDDFSGESAEIKLQDLAWVGPRAVRHDRIIEEIMQYSPVFPAPFGSLFSSEKRLGTLIESNIDAIREFLDHTADKQEWSVKGLVCKSKAVDEIFTGKLKILSETLSSSPAGMRYFKERQMRSEAEKELSGKVKAACTVVGEKLLACSNNFRQRKNISFGKAEGDKQLVVNWAFLVDHSRISYFLDQVEHANSNYQAGGLAFECSGPWPPYSFCPSLHMEPTR